MSLTPQHEGGKKYMSRLRRIRHRLRWFRDQQRHTDRPSRAATPAREGTPDSVEGLEEGRGPVLAGTVVLPHVVLHPPTSSDAPATEPPTTAAPKPPTVPAVLLSPCSSRLSPCVAEPDSPCSSRLSAESEDEPSVEDEAVEKNMRDDSVLEWWKKCSGLHTVEQWCMNYHKHPAGWAALLMIHGVPEVTGRLRAKVENYAMYSALFLSATIPIIMAPSSQLAYCGEPSSPWLQQQSTWLVWSDKPVCEIRKRVFFYSLVGGIASHMLCIILAMAFVNALNEAARDSDVFRMFARGQGYKATVKCQYAFRVGASLCFVSISASASSYVGIEGLLAGCIATYVVLRVYRGTADRLFMNASIVKYWRKELGGNPDEDDPYDLEIAVERFAERSRIGRSFIDHYSTSRYEERKSSKEEKKDVKRKRTSARLKQLQAMARLSPRASPRGAYKMRDGPGLHGGLTAWG